MQHVIKFSFSNFKLVWREAARTAENRRTFGMKVMRDGMFDSRFLIRGPKDIRKFGKKCMVRRSDIG